MGSQYVPVNVNGIDMDADSSLKRLTRRLKALAITNGKPAGNSSLSTSRTRIGNSSSSVLPSSSSARKEIFALDCEMVGVGLLKMDALARVSIVDESGTLVYDSFARPGEEITDYRTSISGVRQSDVESAPSADEVQKQVKLLVLGSILVGHSIHHDTDALLLSHPKDDIRDIAMYYKALLKVSRSPSLKELTQRYLKTNIQIKEHSSVEDAKATMQLYLLQREKWEASILNDCGHGSISQMNIIPRKADLYIQDSEVYLQKNHIESTYSSCEEYVDTQFRLILEDMMRPLRKGVKEYQAWQRYKRKFPKTIRVFYDVYVENCGKELKGYNALYFSIRVNDLEGTNWEDRRMLLNGSLVLLTNDNFKTVKFALVNEIDVETKKGCCLVKVCFVPDGPSLFPKENTKFLMIESVQLFASYRYTLDFLQTETLDKYFIKKYIVDGITTRVPPKYLINAKTKVVDFSTVVVGEASTSLQGRLLAHGGILDFNSWPTKDQLGLDGSQYEALQVALTSELAIIQGPPGCGKTFMALEIVKFHLANQSLLNSPILVVSYTNHSLDQVLEKILEFLCVTQVKSESDIWAVKSQILRVGGGSESEKIMELTLQQKNKDIEKKRQADRRLKRLLERKKLLDNLFSDFASVRLLCVSEKELEAAGINDNDCRLLQIWVNITAMNLGSFKNFFGLKQTSDFRVVLASAGPLSPKVEFGSETDVQNKLQIVSGWLNSASVGETKLGTYKARLSLYAHLVEIIERTLQPSLEIQLSEARNKCSYLSGIRLARSNITHWKQARVIGLTTTGASKYKYELNKAKAKIMIVEEAAHVLEAHVVASLTEHCEQVVLIGDHKQLRPQTGDYGLAKNFKLDVSLMERLVINGAMQGVKNWVQLNVQHRMRPEISSLISPLIYEQLYDHESVHSLPCSVTGVKTNLFFLDHSMPDKKDGLGSTSYINRHEAEFMIRFSNYLVLQAGYDQSRITIIVMYLGQKTLIQNLLAEKTICKDIRVTTVDGFQGEENDIILLSLVRSNIDNRVGFLKTDNRVNVALSRARFGLFIIGNMTGLAASSNTWKQLHQNLVQTNSFGPNLSLFCVNNIHRIKQVSNAADFNKICTCIRKRDDKKPNTTFSTGKESNSAFQRPSQMNFQGISDLAAVLKLDLCGEVLHCGHQCQLVSHPDDPTLHSQYQCKQPCNKYCLRCKNKCPGNHQCCTSCPTSFQCQKSSQVMLLCGHFVEFPCFHVGNSRRMARIRDMVCEECSKTDRNI